jgi:hypothetical protein
MKTPCSSLRDERLYHWTEFWSRRWSARTFCIRLILGVQRFRKWEPDHRVGVGSRHRWPMRVSHRRRDNSRSDPQRSASLCEELIVGYSQQDHQERVDVDSETSRLPKLAQCDRRKSQPSVPVPVASGETGSLSAQPQYGRYSNGQKERGDKEHRRRLRFCRFVARCEEHNHVGQWKATT